MDLSIFLAELLGLYMLIMAAELLFRRKELAGAVKDIASCKGVIICSGSYSLLLGLAIVIAHPIYELDWRGFVTFIGYLMILRGLIRITFPSHLQKGLSTMFRKRYWVMFVVMLVFGAYLTYSGFSAG
ncbi:MAG TPA: hypothetical protein VIJ46_00330 [Rhabdochlamydiaceae bacterium]